MANAITTGIPTTHINMSILMKELILIISVFDIFIIATEALLQFGDKITQKF